MKKDKKKNTTYECTVSFTYSEANPLDAARAFMANLRQHDGWCIEVRDTDTKAIFSVDLRTGDMERIDDQDTPPEGSAACPICGSIWLDSDEAATCCEDKRRKE